VPRLEKVEAEVMPDGRLLLQIKMRHLKASRAKFASDGTFEDARLPNTAALIPEPPQLIGIEEPGKSIASASTAGIGRGMPERCRRISIDGDNSILHSFVNSLRPQEAW